MLNRKRMSLIALTVLVCIVLTAFAGCSKKAADAPAAAEAVQNETVAAPAAATAPASGTNLAHVEETGSLKAWEMSANVWSSSNGATVTFTAVPREYSKDAMVCFVVYLEGEKKEDLVCSWNGTTYTASAELEAADGYEYECVVFEGQGEGKRMALSDAYDNLVYLARSLEAYCNLYISDYKLEDNKFVVTAGFAHVQLPQLTTAGTTVAFSKAELAFSLNGEVIETKPVDLPKGEGEGSHEASLASISFNMPKMEDDYQLDLQLNVTLSNGDELTTPGGSWFFNNGELNMAAG